LFSVALGIRARGGGEFWLALSFVAIVISGSLDVVQNLMTPH